MKFSILFPSRERVQLAKQMLDGLVKNTADLSEIEVLVATDVDDPTDYSLLRSYPFVKAWGVNRSMNFSKDYYNFLAAKSTGEWIICANDDCVFETTGWDKIAFDVLNPLPRVIYGWSEDGLGGAKARGNGNYCCFPLQGRKGYEALGFIFPPRIPVWGADIWAKNLYEQVKSIVDLRIKIMHYCHHNGTRAQDGVSRRIAQNQVQYSVRPTQEEVGALANALNGCLQAPIQNINIPGVDYSQQKQGVMPRRPVMPPPRGTPWVKKKVWCCA